MNTLMLQQLLKDEKHKAETIKSLRRASDEFYHDAITLFALSLLLVCGFLVYLTKRSHCRF